LKIYISTQGGRQYICAYNMWKKKITFFRLDAIVKVKPLDIETEYEAIQEILKAEQPHIWGVSCGQNRTEHLEMKLTIAPSDIHIVHRLEREKRCGTVTQTGDNEWLFTVDVYDAMELAPWLRTFIGRIASLTCSNKNVERRFWSDYATLTEMYGGVCDVV
jgi:hypothetical protein